LAIPNFFLLQEDGFFILQEDGNKIIIGQDTVGGGVGGTSTSVGVSLVKKQLRKKPQLRERQLQKTTNFAKGELLVRTKFNITSKLKTIQRSLNIAVSQLLVHESFSIQSSLQKVFNVSFSVQSRLLIQERFNTSCKILRQDTHTIQSSLAKNPHIETIKHLNTLQTDTIENTLISKKIEKIITLTNMLDTLDKIQFNHELVTRIIIDVTLGNQEIQQGQLLRITTRVNQHVSQLWMRILDKKGVIIQKAGLVKIDATGFQILVSTQQLEKGDYTIQVSNSNAFSPLGIADFEVVDKFPIIPVIAITPGILTPDTDQDIKFVIYRTMMDSKVDDKCKKFENKKFRLNDKRRPVIPQHFNCRCFYEVENDK
jgi:hypothetical protein